MPKKYHKIENPEQPSRAASVPGAEKPRSKKSKSPKESVETHLQKQAVREQLKRVLHAQKEKWDKQLGEDELEDAMADLDFLEEGLPEQKAAKKIERSSAKSRDTNKEPRKQPEAPKEKDVDASHKELRDLETRIARIEIALDDMRETHASSQATQKRVEELLKLQGAKKALEENLLEQTSAAYRQSFEEALKDAEKKPELHVAALDYKELASQRDWMEKELKKRTGKTAEELFMNPSSLGGATARFGRRITNFFGRLAGTEKSTQTADDLLKHWNEVSTELENLANIIQPPRGGLETQLRAQAIRSKADEETEVEQALEREAAREDQETGVTKTVGASIAEGLEPSHLEQGAEVQMALVEASEDIQSLTHELNTLTAESLLALQADFAQKLDSFRNELEEQKKLIREEDRVSFALLQQALQDLHSFELVYREIYAALSEQAHQAAKGAARPKSRVPVKGSSPQGTYGTTSAMKRHARVEMLQDEGPKTELASDIAQEEISAYRAEKAQEINVAMKEFKGAAHLWDQMNRQLAKLDPKDITRLSKHFGTKDIATAYVLDVAFAQMDQDENAKMRVMRANEILGQGVGQNLEEAPEKKSAKKSKSKAATKHKKRDA